MKLSEYIKKYRVEHGLSGRKLAEKMGYSNAYLSLVENEKQKNVGIDFLTALAKTVGLSLDQLLSELDDMNVELNRPDGARSAPDLNFMKSITILGPSACGTPITAQRQYDHITIQRASRADFALIAEGKSMTGCGIMDGSLVLFQNAEIVDNGVIAAVTVDDSTTIKRFYRYGDTVVLKPCNPDYDEQEYSGDTLETIHVFGRAIACLTGFE